VRNLVNWQIKTSHEGSGDMRNEDQ